jgi:hypothetical protein
MLSGHLSRGVECSLAMMMCQAKFGSWLRVWYFQHVRVVTMLSNQWSFAEGLIGASSPYLSGVLVVKVEVVFR